MGMQSCKMFYSCFFTPLTHETPFPITLLQIQKSSGIWRKMWHSDGSSDSSTTEKMHKTENMQSFSPLLIDI